MGAEGSERDAIQNNMLTIILDPEGFGDAVDMVGEIGRFTAWVKESPPAAGVDEVMVPGDPSRKRMAERRELGLPIDPGTWQSLVEAGLSVGLNRIDFEDLEQA
jgi:uncharacterized oxidoreductase